MWIGKSSMKQNVAHEHSNSNILFSIKLVIKPLNYNAMRVNFPLNDQFVKVVLIQYTLNWQLINQIFIHDSNANKQIF